jgi:hypothetical protein
VISEERDTEIALLRLAHFFQLLLANIYVWIFLAWLRKGNSCSSLGGLLVPDVLNIYNFGGSYP